jgi:hypothetical protein
MRCDLQLFITVLISVDCRAPLSPSELIKPEQLQHMDPNKVLIVTTGSQVRQTCVDYHQSLLKIVCT